MVEFDPGPLQDVEARRAGGRWTLGFHQFLPHPASLVWRALTEPEELRTWAPYTANRNLAALGPATVIMLDAGEDSKVDGTVMVVEPEQTLQHNWGGDLLRWQLQATAGGTQLTLEHTLDDHDQLAMMAAGWHLCLLVADSHLAGRGLEPIRGKSAMNFGWEALLHAYESKLKTD